MITKSTPSLSGKGYYINLHACHRARPFTKLLKPVYAYLRSKGLVASGYLDDSFLEGDTYKRCADNVTTTVNLFDSLGFSPHLEKSITTPSQIIEHLGFLLNSIDMTVSITKWKLQSVTKLVDRSGVNGNNPPFPPFQCCKIKNFVLFHVILGCNALSIVFQQI